MQPPPSYTLTPTGLRVVALSLVLAVGACTAPVKPSPPAPPAPPAAPPPAPLPPPQPRTSASSSAAASSSSSASARAASASADAAPPAGPVLVAPQLGTQTGRAAGGRSTQEGQGTAGAGLIARPGTRPGRHVAGTRMAGGSGSAAAAAAPHEGGGSGAAGTMAAGEASPVPAPPGTHAASRSPGQRSGAARQGATGAGDPNAGNGATARHLPDGRDDDIVARRLRRAALEETNPGIRDRLWQEYLDYRENVLHGR